VCGSQERHVAESAHAASTTPSPTAAHLIDLHINRGTVHRFLMNFAQASADYQAALRIDVCPLAPAGRFPDWSYPTLASSEFVQPRSPEALEGAQQLRETLEGIEMAFTRRVCNGAPSREK